MQTVHATRVEVAGQLDRSAEMDDLHGRGGPGARGAARRMDEGNGASGGRMRSRRPDARMPVARTGRRALVDQPGGASRGCAASRFKKTSGAPGAATTPIRHAGVT